MAANGVAPGHDLPVDVDPGTKAAVTAWVRSFKSEAMIDGAYAEMLIGAGHEDLYSLDFDEKDLTEMTDGDGTKVPAARARRMTRGANAVMRKLGIFVPQGQTHQPATAAIQGAGPGGAPIMAQVDPGMAGGLESGATVAPKDRSDPPPYPTGSEVTATGVGTRADMTMWAAEAVVGLKQWTPTLAAATVSLRRNPSQDIGVLEGGLGLEGSVANELFCSDILKILPAKSKKLVGPEMILRQSALEVLSVVFRPVFEINETNINMTVCEWDNWQPCTAKKRLMEWLADMDDKISELTACGEVVTIRGKLAKITLGTVAIAEVKNLLVSMSTQAVSATDQVAAVQRLARAYVAQKPEHNAHVAEESQAGENGIEFGAESAAAANGPGYAVPKSSTPISDFSNFQPGGRNDMCRLYGTVGGCTRHDCRFEPCKTITALQEKATAAAAVQKKKKRKGQKKARKAQSSADESESVATVQEQEAIGMVQQFFRSMKGAPSIAVSKIMLMIVMICNAVCEGGNGVVDDTVKPNPENMPEHASDSDDSCESDIEGGDDSESDEHHVGAGCSEDIGGYHTNNTPLNTDNHPNPNTGDPNVILDLGATIDVVGKEHQGDVIETPLKQPVKLDTAGDTVSVWSLGTGIIDGALGFKDALVAPWTKLSLISLPDRLKRGWSWLGTGDTVTLTDNVGTQYFFKLKNRLYRYWGSRNQPQKQQSTSGSKTAPKATPRVALNTQARKAKPLKIPKHMQMMLMLMVGLCMLGPHTAETKLKSQVQESLKMDKVTEGNWYNSKAYKEHCKRGHLPHDSRCDVCVRSRFTARAGTRNKDPRQITDAGNGMVVGMDLFGPLPPDVDGHVWALIVVEVGHTDFGIVQMLKDKEAASVSEGLKLAINKLERMKKPTLGTVVRVHSDDDKSFLGAVKDYLLDKCIKQTNTGGYRPQNNSRVERRIRMLTEAFRASLLHATGGLDCYDSLWGPGLVHACDCVNRSRWSDGRTPHEALTGEKAVWNKRDHVFGASTVRYSPKEHRASKFEAPGKRAVWVGKSETTVDSDLVVPVEWDADTKIWTLGKTVTATRVAVDDDTLLLKDGPGKEEDRSDQLKQFMQKFTLPSYNEAKGTVDEQVNGEDPELEVEDIQGKKFSGAKARYLIKWKHHKKRTWEPLSHLKGCKKLIEDFELQRQAKAKKGSAKKGTVKAKSAVALWAAMSVVLGTVAPGLRPWPSVYNASVQEADERAVEQLLWQQKQQGSVQDWMPGYQAERDAVRNSGRFKLMTQQEVEELGVASKAIRTRFNLEPKRDGRKKCRWLVQGFREPISWDSGGTDSPVATMSTIRSLVFKKGRVGDVISSVDITTAFLQADMFKDGIDRYVYYQPYKGASKEYYKYLGPVYGSRSSPALFYATLRDWLVDVGYTQSANDPCMFVSKSGHVVVTWVDDIITRGSDRDTRDFYDKLRKRFDIKDPDYLTPDSPLVFLGMQVSCHDGQAGRLYTIDQNTVLDSSFEDWGESYCLNVECPMPCTKALYSDSTLVGKERAARYRSIVGALNYFAVTTRYDIALAVSKLSQFSCSPTVSSDKALTRVIHYLMNNPEFYLESKNEETVMHGADVLQCYSDSGHATDKPNQCRSQTGVIVILNGAPVYWCSRKQIQGTAYSSAMAEIYALSEAVRCVRLVAFVADEMNVKITSPLCIQVDNKQAKSFKEGTCMNSKLRGTVDMRDAWVKELREAKQIEVVHVPAAKQKADVLTKGLPNYKFRLGLNLTRGTRHRRHMAAVANLARGV